MIYCVVPRELEAELHDRLVGRYADDESVTVIVDRRTGPDRRHGRSAAQFADRRQLRDRRRMRIPGTFARTDPPDD